MVEDYIEQEMESGQNFKISISIKVQKIISCILYTISRNFYLFVN